MTRYLRSNAEAYNQLSKNADYSEGTASWVSHGGGYVTTNNDVLTYVITQLTGNYSQGFGQFNWASPPSGIPIIAGHIYLNMIELRSDKNLRVDLNGDANSLRDYTASIRLVPGQWCKVARIKKAPVSYASANRYYSLMSDSTYQLQVGDWIEARRSLYVDLTAMYGAELAEYFLSLENSETGSGIRLFKLLNPLPTYDYNNRTNYYDE